MWFTHFASHNQANNSLQKAAVELLTEHSNLLIPEPHQFIHDLTAKIRELVDRFPRCSPLHPSFQPGTDRWNFWLGMNFTIQFSLFIVKNPEDISGQ